MLYELTNNNGSKPEITIKAVDIVSPSYLNVKDWSPHVKALLKLGMMNSIKTNDAMAKMSKNSTASMSEK